MTDRKPRVDRPERCIRTRGLAAAMQALSELGPLAPLERVAELAGCPKASIARVFESKEALMTLAFAELDRAAIESLRREAQRAGWGRAGARAAAEMSARMASDPAFRGCPINAAGAVSCSIPWAIAAIREHKAHVVAVYVEALSSDMDPSQALLCASAIALICDGIHINASAGVGQGSCEAAIMAIGLVVAS